MLSAVLFLSACAAAPRLDFDRNVSDPPPGPYPSGRLPYGTPTGQVIAQAGVMATSVGAQALRKDDALFDWLGANKKAVGAGVAAAGAVGLAVALADAAVADNRDRWAEYMDQSGAVRRLAMPQDDMSLEIDRWVREHERPRD
ncbi:MAG: hypothetical protein HYY16_15915 [Planctomycetes bacterium]|nr:hypothetical protein [Planctomycetota bacterium]